MIEWKIKCVVKMKRILAKIIKVINIKAFNILNL